jgi:ferredoxin
MKDVERIEDPRAYQAARYAEAEETLNELCRLAMRHDPKACLIGNVTSEAIQRMVNALIDRRNKTREHFEHELEEHLIQASEGEANCGACGACLLAGPCSGSCPRIVMRKLLGTENLP